MAAQQVIDITADFNANSIATIDIGGWNDAIVQLVSPTGAISFLTSSDSGAVTGVSDGSAASAINFTAVTGTNLATATGVTSLNSSGQVKFSVIGQYLRLSGGSATATKILVRLFKTF